MTDNDETKRQQIEELYQRSKRKFPEVADVTAEELRRRREAGEEILLVDVRNPAEQAVSMIPGAVTADELESDPERYRGATVVTYCTIGHRSGIYARKLQKAGWNASNLKGAILSWTHAGGELRAPEGATRRVHVGGPRWNLVADGYEGVW